MADKTTDPNRGQGTETAAGGSKNVPQGAASHVAADEKPKSYKGSRPYIFVSYSHKNETQVLEIIRGLQDHGYRVFYDEGIASGCDWDEYLATRIENCNCICAVFSDEYWASKKCQNELRMAINFCKKPNLGVHLQKHEIPTEFKLIRGAVTVQDVFLYEYNDYQKFLEKLCSSPIFSECRRDPFEADVEKETKDAFIRTDVRGSIGQQGKCFEAEELLSEDKTLSDINYNKTNKFIEHLHQQIEMSIDMILNEIDESTLSEDPDRLKESEAAYEEIVEMEASYNLNRKATRKYIDFLESQEEYTRGIQLARQYLKYKKQSGDALDIREGEECLASLLCHMITSEEKLEEAEELYRDVLEIDRTLAKENPVLYKQDLAKCCFNLAKLLNHYTDDICLSEAEELYREAIALQRGLAAENSASYEEDLASSCYNLANLLSHYSNVENQPEAEELYREAIDIQRELAAEDPVSYEVELASSCYNLAKLLGNHTDDDSLSKAEELYREAIAIQRGLVSEYPASYEEDLASSCCNFAVLLSKQIFLRGEAELELEAEELFREAIHIQKKLVADYPGFREGNLASSYFNLAGLLSYRNDSAERKESESLYGESLEIYRRLGMEIPDSLKETPLEVLSYDTADDKPENYTGSDSYIFISYARKDEAVVLNIIKELQNEGFRVSYDEGIASGKERDAYIADRIENCYGVCIFYSEEYWASEDCLDEFRAFSKKYPNHKPFLGVDLQENKAPSYIPGFVLSKSLKSIHLYEYYNIQNFFGDLTDTTIFQKCRRSSSKLAETNSSVALDYKLRSYKGEDPYIFISYSHKDDILVLDIIKHLQIHGFRVSYAGETYTSNVVDRIKNCYCFCAFFSKAYWATMNCQLQLSLAIIVSKPYLGVHIQEAEIPYVFDNDNRFDVSQDIYFYENSNLQDLLKKMTNLAMFQKCRQMPLEPSMTAELAEPAENDSRVAMDEKPKSYTGKEPYVFISYSHKNEKLVLGIIKHLQDQGFRVFYDEGISTGQEWQKILADHIMGCSCFCAMLSKKYVASKRCKEELSYAQKLDKKFFVVFLEELEETELPSDISMSITLTQHIYLSDFTDQNKFLERLYSNDLMSICRRDPSEPDDDE